MVELEEGVGLREGGLHRFERLTIGLAPLREIEKVREKEERKGKKKNYFGNLGRKRKNP